MESRHISLILVFIVIISILSIYWSTDTLWHNQYDDSYITYRYAVNLATGNGMVFNQGEKTDAASSFLWTVLLAGAYKLNFHDLEMVAFLFNMASIALIAIYSFLIVLMFTKSKFYTAIIGILASVNGAISVWAVLGMETPLVAALILMFIYHFLKHNNTMWLILMLCIIMVRPEGVLLPIIILSYAYIKPHFISFEAHQHNMLIIRRSLFCIIFFGVYTLGRYLYYGDMIPNSARIKMLSNQIAYSRYVAPLMPVMVSFVAIKFAKYKYITLLIIFLPLFFITKTAIHTADIIGNQTKITLSVGDYIDKNIDKKEWIVSSELGAYAYKAINHKFIDSFGLVSRDVLDIYRNSKCIDALYNSKKPRFIVDTYLEKNGILTRKLGDNFLKIPIIPTKYINDNVEWIVTRYSDRNIYYRLGRINSLNKGYWR